MNLIRKSVTIPSLVVGLLVIVGLACSPTAALPGATTTSQPPATLEPTQPPPTKAVLPTLPPTREPIAIPTLEATATPEPIVIPPTATSAPKSGDIIYFTEFDDFKDWYTFSIPDGGRYTNEIRTSQLYIEVNGSNTYAYAFYNFDLGQPDVAIGVRTRTVAGPNLNNISLVCRATDQGWYEFSMTSGGLYYIYLYEKGNYSLLASGGSNAINLQKAQNDLVATCQGQQLTFLINNVQVASVRDSRFTFGYFGLSVSTFDVSGAGVEFDRLAVALP